MKGPKSALGLVEEAERQRGLGRYQDAEALYRKALFKNAHHTRALFGLSVLLFERGRYEESVRFLERLVALTPNEPMLLINLGETYRRLRDLGRAARALQRVLELVPDFPEAHHNLGITFMEAGLGQDALPHLERAVALKPSSSAFHATLSWALLQGRRVVEAVGEAARAVELDPKHVPGHLHLGNALADCGDRKGAIAAYRRTVELDPTDFRAHSNLILVALTDPSYDAVRLGQEARAWAELHAAPLQPFWLQHHNNRDPERVLRVGYLSPDFRGHAVQQFLVPLFQHHHPENVEVYLYSSVERPDGVTEHYKQQFAGRFREIQHLNDASAAELIRRDKMDVLVDLAVHGSGHRLLTFAYRPAPIQMTWLGYSGTTGLQAMDYRITDPHFDPPGTDLSVYSERSIRLPESFWCYDALETGLAVGPLPAEARGLVTFGCLNNFRKVPPEALRLWAKVLERVPGSRLALLVEAQPWVRQLLLEGGVDVNRVDFGGRVSRREYLKRYNAIDVGLDTFPFAGGTTSLDAVWMGVPVVTLSGPTTLQRAGVCIAMNLGMPELVAHTEDEFVSKAVDLATDLAKLAELRVGLRARLEASPFGDHSGFAGHLEAAYRDAWRRYCAS